MPDFFPSRAEFRAGIRAAAQRRGVEEARLFGPRRQTVAVPTGSIPPDLAEELDAIGQQLRDEEALSPHSRRARTAEEKAWMHRLFEG